MIYLAYLRTAVVSAILIASVHLGAQTPIVTVHINSRDAINSFDPDQAIGSSLDVLSRRDIDAVFTPHIVQESLSAGWGPITYRNNSELRMAAWHWNDKGTWSDAAHQSGYFTSSSEPGAPLRYILSYALPHRGFSTSGDAPLQSSNLTYWKSNPYLTHRFTGEADELHPQWIVADMHDEKPVSAIRITWENPFAVSYRVEYWVGTNALDFDGGPRGEWKLFPRGDMKEGRGGAALLHLSDFAITTRFVRILMSHSSETCDEHGSEDARNCVGYAVRELQLGTIDTTGSFAEIEKKVTEKPVAFTTSSIDPWHSAADVNATGNYQHTGFDLFFTSGITNHLPATIPVTLLYGTPEDAAAQIAYLEKRGYAIGYVEMGEEPDGKHAMPEDYAALYVQWATALHNVDPKLKLGGPVFEGVNEDIRVWPDAQGRTSWMGRFIDYLKAHHRLADLAFVSFEHYPFEPCAITWKELYAEPQLMKHILDVWRADGVPPNVPMMVTESHLANQLTGPMTTVFGGLWLADSIGSFFEGGGAVYHHSPIQPQGLQATCLGWSSWSNFVSNENYDIKGYTSSYFAAHVINFDWVQHRSGTHIMFPTSIDIKDASGHDLVGAYALLRPDRIWSLMLVNRDEAASHRVRVRFSDSAIGKSKSFRAPVSVITWGADQYRWLDDGPASHADPDLGPLLEVLNPSPDDAYTLAPASITVLRGAIE